MAGAASGCTPPARTGSLHTRISHALATGAPLKMVQQIAGHASLDTTTRYVTTEAARRMEAMQAVWDAGKSE